MFFLSFFLPPACLLTAENVSGIYFSMFFEHLFYDLSPEITSLLSPSFPASSPAFWPPRVHNSERSSFFTIDKSLKVQVLVLIRCDCMGVTSPIRS